MLSIARTCAVLAAAFALAASPAGAQRRDTAWVVNEAAVSAALRSPDALWAFVTSPRTRWADRTAAVFRSRPASFRSRGLEESVRYYGMEIYGSAPLPTRFVLPMSYMPRVAAALRELRRERALHNWGYRWRKPSEWWRASDTVPPPPFTGSRRRTVLGHPWTVPEEAGFRPEGFSTTLGGPWPEQVEVALRILFDGFADSARPAEFYAAAARLPCTDVADAHWLMDETLGAVRGSKVVTPEAVGIWRSMALNPALPEWTGQDAVVLAHTYMSPSEEAFWLGQALVADIMSRARPEFLRLSFVDQVRIGWIVADSTSGKAYPPPHVARLAFARRVDALPSTVSPLTRSVLAFWVVRDLDPAAAATFPPSPRSDARHEERFALYREWFARNRPALERLAAPQEARVAAVRRAMDAVTTCRDAR